MECRIPICVKSYVFVPSVVQCRGPDESRNLCLLCTYYIYKERETFTLLLQREGLMLISQKTNKLYSHNVKSSVSVLFFNLVL